MTFEETVRPDFAARACAKEQRSRRSVLLGAGVVLSAFAVLVPAKLWRPHALFTINENVQMAEAGAWWSGRLDLPERKWDTALKDGRVYSHFPPMFTFIAAAIVPVFRGVPHPLIVALLILPAILLPYALFLRLCGSAGWACIVTIGFVCGTSLLPVLDKTLRGCGPFFVNQTLGTIGLVLLLFESFGRRRLWLMGIGLIVAAWSRQMTIACVIPLVYIAWWQGSGHRTKRVLGVGLILVVVAGVPYLLNWMKFGHPLDSGYMHVYENRREDNLSRDAKAYGLFSGHFVPRNLYYANIGFPEVHTVTVADEHRTYLRPNHMATGIWWTTPLLAWALIDIRRIGRNPTARAWLIAAALAYVGLLFYHSTGFEQRGFNRYSLDYVPVLFALIVPHCLSGRRRWVTLGMVAWGVAYFASILPMPHVRIW